MKIYSAILCSALISGASAFVPASRIGVPRPTAGPFAASKFSEDHSSPVGSFTGDFLNDVDSAAGASPIDERAAWIAAAAPLAVALTPAEAQAADGSGGQLASAFAAYGHYLSLFVIVGCLVVERLTIKPNMSDEEEDRIAIADTTLGAAGVLLAYTGYLRTTAEWGKGFDYYAHEPVFWLKTFFVAIFGAVSFFPTTKIIQRSVAKRNGNLEPMSEALANRLTSLINAELLMVGSIPLTATLMARGVGYNQSFPWQVGAVATVGALGGLGFKYVREALTWEEPSELPKAE